MKKSTRIDNHYYSTPEQREYLNRQIFDREKEERRKITFNSYHRERLFPRDWKVKLEEMKRKHRKMGFDDSYFQEFLKKDLPVK